MKSPIATIKLTTEVHAIVSGLKPSEYEMLKDEFSYHAKNYFFSPEYQLERWDGKINYFFKSGLTYIEILDHVIQAIKELDYKIKIVDARKPFKVKLNDVDVDYFSDYGWTLAKHQLKAIKAVIKNNHRGIIKVGTGGGKTLITGVLADLYQKAGKRIIVIVPNKDLIVQTKEEIQQFDIEVGAYYTDEKNLKPDIVVSTWQSLGRNDKILNDFDGVMVDECHGASASVLKSLLSGDAGKHMAIRIGLSGTLPDHETDKLTVFTSLGKLVAEVKSEQLIKEGWLAKLNLVMMGYKEDFKKEYQEFLEEHKDNPDIDVNKITYAQFKNKFLFPEYQNEKTFLLNNTDRLESIAELIKKATEKYGNSFVLVNSVNFGKNLAKILGENSIFISSSIKDRKPIYDSFDENNNITGIATYNLASTGLNIPRLFNVFLIDGGKSSVRVIQTIGRGLRKARDKDEVNVIDVYSSVVYSSRHAGKRRKIYKSENYNYSDIKNLKYDSQKDKEKTVQNMVKTLDSLRTKKDLEEEVFD